MARSPGLLTALAIATTLALPAGGALAHDSGPFSSAVRDIDVTSPTSVKARLQVRNDANRAKRVRCTLEAYSFNKGTSVTETVGMRVPPFKKENGYAVAEEVVRFHFPDGPIKPVTVSVLHCHGT